MLICCTFVSSGKLAQSVECGANNSMVLCSRLTFCLECFLFLSSLLTFIAFKILTSSRFVSGSPLAQLVERGVNNGKVESSRLIPSKFHFLFGSLSIFK